MKERCYVFHEKEWTEAEFIGVYQFSNVIEPSPMIGGHPGGVIAYPVVVVKMDDKLKDFGINKVKFSKEG